MDSAARIYDMYESMLENILQDPSEPPVPLPFEFLRAITDDFSNDNEIGRGAFGAVYKGILRSGKVIAVKKIYDTYPIVSDNSLDELSRVMGIMNPNVVQLIGYCAETKMDTVTQDSGKLVVAEVRSRLLCFEYLCNGGLDKYISKEHLDLGWDKIYSIIKGICGGLQSLHEEKIVHLDLKPQNILLDGNMVPKIVDFGLARLLSEKQSKVYTQRHTGTVGYIAPEYYFQGKISPKADIFSMGVIMIELITGSRNYPHWTPSYSYISYENRPGSTQAQLQQFTQNELETWRKIFDKTLNDASLVEVYTHQQKQLIDIALKCVDSDPNKRPNAADILDFFSHDEGGSSCDPIGKYSQVRDLVSVEPIELKIPVADPNKLHRSSCLLHLNNDTAGHVAFRVQSNTLARHFIWPRFGFVPPGCRYTIAVTMRYQENAASSEDQSFTLETTRASDQEIRNVISRHSNYSCEGFFARAKDRGRQVHLEKLTLAYVNSEEMAHLPASKYNDSIVPLTAKFIATKKWIIVGCSSGYIKVYNYCKQSLFSEIESIKAHGGHGDILSLQQTGPYVLSSVVDGQRNTSIWDNPMDKIKLWDWENGWKLICTFNMEEYTQVISHPMDMNTFLSTSGVIKVWNTCSPDFVSEIPGLRHAACLDFFSRDGAVYMIVTSNRKVSIWDYQNMKCVTKLKAHTSDVDVVFSHPELPVLITGSYDGTVRLWSSLTFSILGVLNCGLGAVMAIASLKESKRIAIAHYSGLAIAEIDTFRSVVTGRSRD